MSELKHGAAMNTEDHGLKKHDIKVSTVVFMIFCLVAAGCYGIEEMIPEAGPGLTIILLIVLPFVWGLPFGLVASELGSVRPQEGGYYKWVQEALGEFWGFQAGWWRTISIYIDNTLYVILAGGYAATAWDLSRPAEFAIKVAMIAIFTFINIRGVRDVGIVSTILSILVIVAFAMVAVCGFMNWGEGTDISFQITPEPAHGAMDWFFYIAGGLSIGMWMYSGYESMSTIAGEIKNPQVIPKGTLITIPLIMCVYIFPTVAGLGSLGKWSEWASDGGVGYANVVETFWGVGFSAFFVVVAILAQCSIYNTYIASGSRGFFSLADDHLAPPMLVKCDKKHGVPYVAVLSVAIVNLILCMLPFGVVIVLDVFLLVSSYIMVYISAMILRKRIPAEEYQFKTPGGYGFLCVICVIPMCIAFFSFFVNGSDYFLGGMIGLLSGPVLYFIWRRMYGGLTAKDPVAFPKNEKTGLAQGDLRKLAFMLLILTIIGLVGIVFLPFYEDGWAAEYYYDGMFEDKFGSSEAAQLAGGAAIFGITMTIVKIVTAITGVLTIVCAIVASKIEPKKVKKQNKIEA
ncbi:MAG: APC family permease [Eubacteriaceae bacterium]|nr:APC family permease [Eubacteriaceae bacterium]